jgi:WD40 repeat protein
MNIFNNENLLKLFLSNLKPLTKNKICCNINNKILYRIIIQIFNFDEFYKSLGSSKITINTHENQLNSLTLISENKIASTCYSSEFKIWDIEALKCITLKGHSNNVSSILSLGNNHIVSCSRGGEIKVWDCLNNYECIVTKSFKPYIWLDNLLLLPGEKIACSECLKASPYILIINCKDDYRKKVLTDYSNPITNIVNIHDCMFAASGDKRVSFWDAKTYKCLRTL